MADKTNADLTVNTENGKVTLDQETIKTVLGAAKGATITLEVTKVAKPTEAQKKAETILRERIGRMSAVCAQLNDMFDKGE